METRTPDTRVVQNLGHGALDAVLVDSYRGNYPWTHAETSPGNAVTAQDVQLFVQRELSKLLATKPELKGQRFDDDRKLMQYIAAEAVEKSVKSVHLRQRPADEFAKWLHDDLLRVLQTEQLLTAHPLSRLSGEGEEIKGDQQGLTFWVQPIKKGRYDPKLLKYFVGSNPRSPENIPRLISLLEEATGELLTKVDRSHLSIHIEQYRAAIWELLAKEHNDYPSESLRKNLRSLTIDAWAEHAPDIHQMTKLEERISTKTPVNLETDSVEDVLRICFDSILTKEDPSEEDLTTLREHMVILESRILIAADTNEIRDLIKLQSALTSAQKLLQLQPSDYPQIAFTEIVIASAAIDTTINHIKTII